jgi:hypothetical protein
MNMSRPSKWATPTTAIRVPSHLADKLLDYAKLFDTSFVQNSNEEIERVMITLDCGTTQEKRSILAFPKSIWEEADRLADELIDRLIANGYSNKEIVDLAIFALDKRM